MAQIAEVIKYEGDNRTFIWKHPSEDFNSLTQLIVHESQEAIFFMNGQALDLFGPGRHTLETQNIPKIGKFLNRVTGDQTPFHCEVYFINKTEQMSIKWGTDSKVQYMEPKYGFPISIGACGEMSLRAEDSRKLLLKLVGTESSLTQTKIVEYFRAFLMTKIKTYIAQTIKAKEISIFEIDGYLTLLSSEIQRLLVPDFLEYGIVLEHFFVTTVLKPDGETQYERFKELHYRKYADVAAATIDQEVSLIYAETDAKKTVIESQAMATKRAQEGYTYHQERGFDVMSEIARNEGSGSDLRNAAMGIGMGFGVGGAFGNTINDIANGTMNGLMNPVNVEIAQNQLQEDSIPGMIRLKEDDNTSNNENLKQDDDMIQFKNKVEKLTMMREAGILTEEEFTEQKKQLLNMI